MKRKLLLMGVVLSMFLPIGVVGQTWDPPVGSDNFWCTTTNWQRGYPTSSSTILLQAGENIIIPVGCDASVGVLGFAGGGQVTIQGSLKVYQYIVNLNSEFLKIEDGGSLVYSPTNFGYLPKITVKRNLTGANKYHYISSPIANTTIGSIFDSDLYDNIWLRNYNEPNGTWVELNTTFTLTPGIGYNYYSDQETVTATFTGNLNINNKTVSLSYGYPTSDYKGFNLIGNPFASPIDWDLVSVPSSVYSTIWVWNSSSANYITYNKTTDPTNLNGGIVPSCQGFFVQTDGIGQSLTLPYSAQVTGTNNLYKNAIPNVLSLEITSDKNSYRDEAYVAFKEQASTNSDLQFDAQKLYGLEEAPQLYTRILDKNYTINCLPSIEQVPQVPLCLESGIDATFTLKAEGMESFNGTIITLTDKKTGYSQQLNSNAEYTFEFTSGEAADRFMLSFEPVGLKEKQELNMGIYTIGNIVKIKFDEANSGTVKITGLTGQVVYSEKFSRAANLDLNTQLPEGVYLVTVTTDDKISSRKVFIK